MDSFLNNLSSHQPSLTVVAIIALLIVYFLFKKLVKMALIFTLILLAVGGYLYTKDPKKISESIKQTVEKVKLDPGKLMEKGKNAYRDGKDLFERGKKLPGQIDRLITGKEKKEE